MINTTSGQAPEQSVYPPQYKYSGTNSPGETITCGICDAGFTWSMVHLVLLQKRPMALEAAFMSMCHFCFRCRRPACPECWDMVHGVCGACVQETHLPFRAEAAPLAGVIFPPLYPQAAKQNIGNNPSPLLACVSPGRFRVEISLATVATGPLKSAPVMPKIERPAMVDHEEQLAFAPPSQQPSSQLPKQTRQLARQAENEEVPVKNRARRFFKVVERVLTVLALVILCAIVALIVLAELSLSANIQIIRLLHIDIRGEVTYLITLIHQLHW